MKLSTLGKSGWSRQPNDNLFFLFSALIFQGLDALTTEDTLAAAVYGVSALTELKNLKIIRDEITNTSRGYGFVELNSVMESTQLLETMNSLCPPFEVDGKQIIISFAKNTFSTV